MEGVMGALLHLLDTTYILMTERQLDQVSTWLLLSYARTGDLSINYQLLDSIRPPTSSRQWALSSQPYSILWKSDVRGPSP